MDKILKILNIHKDEIGKVLIFGLILGIRTAGCTIGWVGVQTIILKRLGIDSLPYSFIFFAIIGMIGALIYLFFADAVPRDKLLKIFCFITGILLISSAILLTGFFQKTGLIIASFLILTGNGMGYSTTGIQIWTIINDAFRPSQGTRVYPVIAIAPLLGSIIGGAAIPVIVEKFNMAVLILFWGLTVLTTIPLLSILNKFYGREISQQTTYLVRKKDFLQNLIDGYKFSLKSPIVHILTAICILFWTVASLKEFQYSRIINDTFTTEAELGKFFGYFTIYLHITVLIIQFLFTGKVVKLTGVSRGFLILPVTIFTGITGILIYYSFYSGLIMRFSWDIIAMTIQGTVFQLSFNAISGPYRGRIRGILEGCVNPIGGVIGGGMIILINNFLYPSHDTGHKLIITLLGLFFSLLWIFSAVKSVEIYKRTIIENLKSQDRRTFLDTIEMIGEFKKPLALKELSSLLYCPDYEKDEEVKSTIFKTMELYGYKIEEINNFKEN